MLTDLEKDAIRHHYQTLATALPGFKPRPSQRRMIAEIANALSRCKERDGDELPEREGESILAVEGPTGVGKSVAYLIAGGVMAKNRAKKLIVSSATVALQEQLVNRDLPFVVEHSELPLTYALAKGRGRYACPYRLFQLTADSTQGELLAPDPAAALWERKPEAAELAAIKALADAFYYKTWNGDRDDYPEMIDDALWLRVTNDRHGCLKAACPNRPECPFYIARDALENVDVVVTNHDLLLADCAMGGGVILPAPEQSFYCIDEAHHLSKKAVNQFAADFQSGPTLGWLDKVATLASHADTLLDKHELVDLLIDSAAASIEHLTQFVAVLDGIEALSGNDGDDEPTWLLPAGPLPEGVDQLAANLQLTSAALEKQLEQLSDALAEARKDKSGGDMLLIDRLSSELGFFISRAEPFAAVWALFVTEPEDKAPPIARWITARAVGNRRDYRVSASPVSAAGSLASTLWRKAAGAVLTSATLRSLNSFDLLLRQTGLVWLPETSTLALDSPFDFAHQGELYLPPLAVSPKDAAGHTAEIVKWLPRLVDLSQPNGTLMLFSSRRQMEEVADRLPPEFAERVLVQGTLPKSKLLARHLEAVADGRASLIFGLDSFAEGLDLPGEACVHVIIAKLPFAMPDDPVGLTLSKWIESQGGNPFIELSVPEASVKLIQAVGRLIRTESDYGRVSILDTRLKTAAYGKKILAALPPFRRI
ncbi:MAG: ATP-dependent DNA helicase DinG [Microvirgula sp.]